MDADGSGEVDFREFYAWWGREVSHPNLVFTSSCNPRLILT